MENIYKTNNISLTAFLLTQGIILNGINRDSSQQVSFLLSNPKRCELLKKKYINHASAPAQELFAKREMLISEIKQYK